MIQLNLPVRHDQLQKQKFKGLVTRAATHKELVEKLLLEWCKAILYLKAITKERKEQVQAIVLQQHLQNSPSENRKRHIFHIMKMFISLSCIFILNRRGDFSWQDHVATSSDPIRRLSRFPMIEFASLLHLHLSESVRGKNASLSWFSAKPMLGRCPPPGATIASYARSYFSRNLQRLSQLFT